MNQPYAEFLTAAHSDQIGPWLNRTKGHVSESNKCTIVVSYHSVFLYICDFFYSFLNYCTKPNSFLPHRVR